MSFDESIETLQRAMVSSALKQAEGHLGGAAEILKIERSRLGKLRTRLGLVKPGSKAEGSGG